MRARYGALTPGARWRLATLCALGLACLALLGPAPAHACSCSAEWDPAGWFDGADGAIIGKLVRVHDRGEHNDFKPSIYVYRVQEVFKGRGRGLRAGELVRVRSARDGATCGLPRKHGQRLGLFMDRRRHRWHSGLCSTLSPNSMRRAARQADRDERAGSASATGC